MASKFRLPEQLQDKSKGPLYNKDGSQRRQSTLQEIAHWLNMMAADVRTGVKHVIDNGEIVAYKVDADGRPMEKLP